MAKVTWPTFQILGPPNISGTAEDTNLKFCKQIDLGILNQKNEKLVKSGHGLDHVTYFLNFGTPPNISGTAEDTNLKFCMQTDLEGY